MNLKNYTSEVPAVNSQGRISKALVQAGATDISMKYDGGICVAITFRMLVDHGGVKIPLFFQLPAKVESCFDVMWKEIKRPRPDTKMKTRQQAERTAWKIVSDWVEVQLSMILLEQAEAIEIFLPYVFDPQKQETFFQRLKGSGFKQLSY